MGELLDQLADLGDAGARLEQAARQFVDALDREQHAERERTRDEWRRRRVLELLAADPDLSANAIYRRLLPEKLGTRAMVLEAVRDAKRAGTSRLYRQSEAAA